MASTKEYRLRVYHKHGRDQVTVMNGEWQDYAGSKRDQRVVEEGKPEKWLTCIQTRQFIYDVAD